VVQLVGAGHLAHLYDNGVSFDEIRMYQNEINSILKDKLSLIHKNGNEHHSEY